MSMRRPKAKQIEEEKGGGRIARSLYLDDAPRDFGLELDLSTEREILALKQSMIVERFTFSCTF